MVDAAIRTANTDGARFTGTGTGFFAGRQVRMDFAGAYDSRGHRSQVTIRISGGGAAPLETTLAAVEDGPVTYLSSPIFERFADGAQWVRVDGSETDIDLPAAERAMGAINVREMLESARALAPNATRTVIEEVRGVRTTHFAGVLDPALEAEQAPAARDGLAANLPTESGVSPSSHLWIDEQGLVRRIEMATPVRAPSVGGYMSIRVELYDIGVVPPIEVPSETEVFDATELRGETLDA